MYKSPWTFRSVTNLIEKNQQKLRNYPILMKILEFVY